MKEGFKLKIEENIMGKIGLFCHNMANMLFFFLIRGLKRSF